MMGLQVHMCKYIIYFECFEQKIVILIWYYRFIMGLTVRKEAIQIIICLMCGYDFILLLSCYKFLFLGLHMTLWGECKEIVILISLVNVIFWVMVIILIVIINLVLFLAMLQYMNIYEDGVIYVYYLLIHFVFFVYICYDLDNILVKLYCCNKNNINIST